MFSYLLCDEPWHTHCGDYPLLREGIDVRTLNNSAAEALDMPVTEIVFREAIVFPYCFEATPSGSAAFQPAFSSWAMSCRVFA